MIATRFAVLLGAALTLSGTVNAQEARPIRFWVSVMELGATAPKDAVHNYQVPISAIPTPLVGWMCQTSAIRLNQYPGNKAMVVNGMNIPASAPYVYQSADLACLSKSGKVEASASCTLTSENVSDHGEIRITDVAGRPVWVGIHCDNSVAPPK
jgi:hypothetical protein